MTANATFYLLKGQVLTTTALSAISGAPAAASARTAGGGFQAFVAVALDVDAHAAQRHLQGAAGRFAMPLPGIGFGMQAVVDVQRAQVTRARRAWSPAHAAPRSSPSRR